MIEKNIYKIFMVNTTQNYYYKNPAKIFTLYVNINS